ALPAPDGAGDARVGGQLAVQVRLVGVLQHVHHVGAADALRVVDAGAGKTATLELLNAFRAVVQHVLLAAEADRAGRAGLHAGRLLADRDAVRAQGALVGLVVPLADARHVERAAGDAVAAADAVLGLEVDDAVGVLHDGARLRAGRQAARLGAVHAAVLADQPLQAAALVVLVLVEAHDGPGIGGQVDGVVVDAVVVADLVADVVPLRTGHLAGLAADAGGHVDQLGHFGLLVPRLGRGGQPAGGGAFDDVLGLHGHERAPLHLFHVDEEGLVFGGVGVGVTHARRQGV